MVTIEKKIGNSKTSYFVARKNKNAVIKRKTNRYST